MSLTEEGHHYLTRFEQIMNDVATLEEEITLRHNVTQGTLTITAPMFIGQYYVQPIISEFIKKYPEVKFSWLMLDRYVNLIEEGIDLAVRVGHLTDSSLVARTIGHMRLKVVASPLYIKNNQIN